MRKRFRMAGSLEAKRDPLSFSPALINMREKQVRNRRDGTGPLNAWDGYPSCLLTNEHPNERVEPTYPKRFHGESPKTVLEDGTAGGRRRFVRLPTAGNDLWWAGGIMVHVKRNYEPPAAGKGGESI